ncbi:unnamed protein product [Peronospora destructor]|uniref:Peptidase M24 domain-containing protein n=1 Tax=Peronospora destructor TaxID=86335 RepID=A0AAV0SZS3_9STRA|nr:unnamed protein product [Peronospora destructor]
MRCYFGRFASRPRVAAGHQTSVRSVPKSIIHPPYAASGEMSDVKPFIPILDAEQQQRLRAACALARDIREFAKPLCQPGATTEDIDCLVHEEIVRRGAYPTPLNYGGFPKALCSSVNEIVVHGIPDSRPLVDGDIVNIDISVFLDGFHGDTGNHGGAGCRAGYTGHGIGKEFHCLPFILHHRNNEPGKMMPGMAFTVEPALTEGSPKIVHWDDGWTVATADGGRSAQAEHTVLITEDGVDIVT